MSGKIVGKIVQVESPALKTQRTALLNHQLRSFESNPHIDEEYPIVLENAVYSFAYLDADDRMICHANLWPRRFRNSGLEVALIGNVATAHGHEGKGYMQVFLSDLMKAHPYEAYILWSDKPQFFSKLDFYPFGEEYRVGVDSCVLLGKPSQARYLHPPYSIDDLSQLIAIPHPFLKDELERSAEEFAQLLSIPHTTCVVYEDQSGLSYGICGKGADMQGVVHEWRASSTQGLREVLSLCSRGLDQLIILSPLGSLALLTDTFKQTSIEQHPIGLARTRTTQAQTVLNHGYIWGLDSI